MSRLILIRTYSPKTAETIVQSLQRSFVGLWLEPYVEEVFHICDELIKNGVKSNYKTILYWMEARKRFQAKNPDVQIDEIDEWLYEVFYSGENQLISLQFSKVERDQILRDLLIILEMEAMYIDHRMGRRNLSHPTALRTLLRIKRFCKKHRIGVQLRIEPAGDRINITVANDAPILEEDLARIQAIRSSFRQYQMSGNEEEFFVEHVNTGGGGHGLGYPLMDSILLNMNLDPDTSLFLISATRTMILLSLPMVRPEKPALLSLSTP